MGVSPNSYKALLIKDSVTALPVSHLRCFLEESLEFVESGSCCSEVITSRFHSDPQEEQKALKPTFSAAKLRREAIVKRWIFFPPCVTTPGQMTRLTIVS